MKHTPFIISLIGLTLLALLVYALSSCADLQTSADRWSAYQTDLQVIKQLQRYTCGACQPRRLEGFSKDSGDRKVSSSRTVTPSSYHNPVQQPQPTEQANRQIYDLSQKISTLEEALKTNANTTNQNEALLVQQIVALKSQLSQIQSAGPVAAVTPKQSQETGSGLRIPGND